MVLNQFAFFGLQQPQKMSDFLDDLVLLAEHAFELFNLFLVLLFELLQPVIGDHFLFLQSRIYSLVQLRVQFFELLLALFDLSLHLFLLRDRLLPILGELSEEWVVLFVFLLLHSNYISLTHHFFCKMLKKYYTSSVPSSGRSVQWTPFLALSRPNTARKDLGRTDRASSGSCGPQSSLRDGTTFSCLTYKAMHGPFVNYYTIWLYSGTTPL